MSCPSNEAFTLNCDVKKRQRKKKCRVSITFYVFSLKMRFLLISKSCFIQIFFTRERPQLEVVHAGFWGVFLPLKHRVCAFSLIFHKQYMVFA
jgi:hypothetical protein